MTKKNFIHKVLLLGAFFIARTVMASADLPGKFNIETLKPVLDEFGWKKEHLKFGLESDFSFISSPQCRFFSAYNGTVPGAGVINFALDAEGRLIASSGDMAGLSHVLRNCIPADASPTLWAELISAFMAAVHPTVVGERDKLTQSAIPSYRPAEKFVQNGDTYIEFFALEHNLRVVHVKAKLPSSGVLKVDIKAVAKK